MQRMDSILPLSNMCVCDFVQASMCGEGLVLCASQGEVWTPYVAHSSIQKCLYEWNKVKFNVP